MGGLFHCWLISLYATFTAGGWVIQLLDHIFERQIHSWWVGHFNVGSYFCTPHSQLVSRSFQCWIIFLYATFTAGGWVISLLDHNLSATFTAGGWVISLLDHIFVRYIHSWWVGHFNVGSYFSTLHSQLVGGSFQCWIIFCSPHSQLVGGSFHCWFIFLYATFTAGGRVILL